MLGHKGLEFTEDAIGNALATRALLDMLRQSGEFGGGPAPYSKSDRSKFLAKLDETIHAVRRSQAQVERVRCACSLHSGQSRGSRAVFSLNGRR